MSVVVIFYFILGGVNFSKAYLFDDIFSCLQEIEGKFSPQHKKTNKFSFFLEPQKKGEEFFF